MTRTGIIATLGPSTSDAATLKAMAAAGLDAARFNFSHGTLSEHLARLNMVRRVNKSLRRRLKIIGDLEGFRIRIGRMPPLELREGGRLVLKRGMTAPRGDVPLDFSGDLRAIPPGKGIFIDDGNLELLVESSSRQMLTTRIVRGGVLRERKGVNIPGAQLGFRGLSAKDISSISFCIEQGFDFIAQSFVRSAADIGDIRKLLSPAGRVGVIAKIENEEGIRRIESILAVSDGIMIARGDMGVSIPVYKVPFVQKHIIGLCSRAKKFSITATQMLESMARNRVPTRAEVSDVANAVLDGSDYLMLSAETSVGRYPEETVRMMNRIIAYAEQQSARRRA